MALSTKVHIRYRTPYMPNINLPLETEKLMRQEISNMRKDLIKKQYALQRSSKYEANERLLNDLKNIEVKNLKNTRDVWNTWNRLRNLELSNQTSVSGKNLTRKKAIESFHQSGFTEINEENYDDFTHFMEKVKDEFQALVWDSEQLIDIYFEHLDDNQLDNLNWEERYNYMLDYIIMEMRSESYYMSHMTTEDKWKSALRRNANELNKTFIAKNAFEVPKNRRRVTSTEILNYKYKRGPKK